MVDLREADVFEREMPERGQDFRFTLGASFEIVEELFENVFVQMDPAVLVHRFEGRLVGRHRPFGREVVEIVFEERFDVR